MMLLSDEHRGVGQNTKDSGIRERKEEKGVASKQGKEKYPKNIFKESVVLRLVVNVSTFGQQLSGSPRLPLWAFASSTYKPIALVACLP